MMDGKAVEGKKRKEKDEGGKAQGTNHVIYRLRVWGTTEDVCEE